MDRYIGILGIVTILALGWIFSTNRKAIRWRTILWGLGLQIAFALLMLKTPFGERVFALASGAVDRILSFTDVGAGFLFGNLYRGDEGIAKNLGPGAMQGYVQVTDSATGQLVGLGIIFAIHVLPTIIFFSSLMSVLYHLGIMQRIVSGIAWVMQRTMKTSGSETLSVAADIFVGQTEAPLVVRPFVARMTMSELMAIMVGGFATVAGGVMAAYVRFGIDAGHLLTASVMSAPAALLVAKLFVPETQASETARYMKVRVQKESVNLMDAAASGAAMGLKLAANVAAMLLAFIALIALVDYVLALAARPFGETLSLARVFGWVFSPFAWLMGVPWEDAPQVGRLMGTKMAVNEFLAYVHLGQMELSHKATVIATYALCGFANFGSIAIQIGGTGGMAPERRQDIARLGFRAMIAGTLATAMTACFAGVLVG